MTADLLSGRKSVPTLLAAVAVALQIAYPLVHGAARDQLTVAVVIVLAGTWVAHAAVSRGTRIAALLLLITALPGFAVEVLGAHTAVPFGRYTYASSLGPRLFDVPLVVGPAWTMIAWPAAIAARRLVAGRWARIVVGAWALASADLFLDPQMVAAGHWTWRHPTPHLPGVTDVPLTNFAGWLAIALMLSAGVQTLLGTEGSGDDSLPILLYLWLYTGWIVALAVFLGLLAAAGWGALGMGLVAIPLALTEGRGRW